MESVRIWSLDRLWMCTLRWPKAKNNDKKR